MRTIEYTNQFKRDWKREQRGKYRKALQEDFPMILQLLLEDQPLPERCFDHALAGKWSDHRDCHIKPDLVLIYRKPTQGILQRVRLGSHANLGF